MQTVNYTQQQVSHAGASLDARSDLRSRIPGQRNKIANSRPRSSAYNDHLIAQVKSRLGKTRSNDSQGGAGTI